jgi:uncharacterized protein (TIGR02231 family)
VKVDAPVVAVTVYPDRARIVRRGVVALDAGAHELVVPDLTQLLDADSVRVSGSGTAHVRILGVDVRREYYVETPSVPAAELRRKLESQQDADQALQDELKLLDDQLLVLSTLGQHAGESLARGIGRGRVQIGDAGALLEFVGAEHNRLSARKREVAVQRRGLLAEVTVLRRELERIEGAQPRERYTAAVGVEAAASGEFSLDLEYTTVGGAGWWPLYDLRLLQDEQEPQIELSCLGQVRQSTGEDWNGVDLTLSTSRPAVSAQLPNLAPWYVNLYEPSPGVRYAKRAAPAPAMADLSAGAEPPMMMEEAESAATESAPIVAEAVEAVVDTSGTAVTFHIPRRVDVPADNTACKVTITTLHLIPDLDYLSIPKLVGEVYRRCKVKNDSAAALLPGPVSLFHGSEFVGSATLEKVAPQETFEATLGVDDRVTVERKLVLKEVGKQFIGDRRVLRYAYEIQVQNLLDRMAQVAIVDQGPIAGHEDIRVKMEAVRPAPTSESEQGELTWNLELDAQERQTLRFEFTVSAPRNATLVGLPED